jgi:hypothetical protein
VEPGEVGTADRVQYRRSRRRRNRKKHGRRHMSVEDLYLNELATASSSEDDHLARVSDLKSFFENLNTPSSETVVCVAATKSPVVEVTPLVRSKLSMFENPNSAEDEGKRERHVVPEEIHSDWPSVRKTSCKFGSPSHSLTSSSSSSGKGSGKEQPKGKEQGKAKGSRSKRDS